MSWFLRRSPLAAVVALSLALGASPAWAGFGGGYGGTSGSAIWALAWWAGSPAGPGGPYTGPPSAVDQCIWHDTGSSVAGLGTAISQSSLPQSFLVTPQSGGHPGIWGILQWATALKKTGSSIDHFDLVACPESSQVPATGGDVEANFPEAHPPGENPMWIWAFWDTVEDPPTSALPPVVDEAFREIALGAPAISTSPSTIDGVTHATVVNLPTWLWIQPSIWQTVVASATAGPITATVWAEPSYVTWTAHWDFSNASEDPQHGTTLAAETLDTQCAGPGIAYSEADPPDGVAGSCTAVFTEPTLNTYQPLGAAITWVVHWAVSNTAGVVGGEGLLSPVITSSTQSLRVMQVESIISSG